MDYTRRGLLSMLGIGVLAGCIGQGGSSPTETPADATTTATATTTEPTETPKATTTESPTTELQTTTESNEVIVAMVDVALSPMRFSIDPGTTVVWENREGLSHNVRSQQFHDVATEWDFQSETVGREGRVSYEFENEGIYEYDCGIHGSQAMCGVALVGDVSLDEPLPCE
ncbi:plastocyanin/azurin family copper-binding protein [Haloferax sp. DFSO60]|uniref:cupredoxin domain-containing protein n=1 Tax=Haloferax sp. DFSO60 TaxID=3388652 RepID=UPI00397B8F09